MNKQDFKKIDMHVHTTASDGTMRPDEVVELAAEIGLSAIAITDHDTVRGIGLASMMGEELGVEVIHGVELSTKYDCTVHILGYFIETDTDRLLPMLRKLVQDRDERNKKIVELMQCDGINITYEEMKENFGGSIGRPHFAQILVEKGVAKDLDDAFSNYVDRGQKYYIKRKHYDMCQSIKDIKAAGGIPVLAHPFQYKKNDAELRKMIEDCIEAGLIGMECEYSGYTTDQMEYLKNLAKEYNLYITGGSDFHGSVKPKISLGSGTGNLNINYEYLEKLKHISI